MSSNKSSYKNCEYLTALVKVLLSSKTIATKMVTEVDSLEIPCTEPTRRQLVVTNASETSLTADRDEIEVFVGANRCVQLLGTHFSLQKTQKSV